MKEVFAPGCALVLYKPEHSEKIIQFLNKRRVGVAEHLTCCQHEPLLEEETRIINVCPGCDKRYQATYEGVSTISLWEILEQEEDFPFPDYGGMQMSIHDACPTRGREEMLNAIRTLLCRMNIELIEPENTRGKAVCCGDTFYDVLPVEDVKKMMTKRAEEMPCENVVVYCVSCIKSMHIGGKTPRYLLDLLLGEDTHVEPFDPEEWHRMLDEFIEKSYSKTCMDKEVRGACKKS